MKKKEYITREEFEKEMICIKIAFVAISIILILLIMGVLSNLINIEKLRYNQSCSTEEITKNYKEFDTMFFPLDYTILCEGDVSIIKIGDEQFIKSKDPYWIINETSMERVYPEYNCLIKYSKEVCEDD